MCVRKVLLLLLPLRQMRTDGRTSSPGSQVRLTPGFCSTVALVVALLSDVGAFHVTTVNIDLSLAPKNSAVQRCVEILFFAPGAGIAGPAESVLQREQQPRRRRAGQHVLQAHLERARLHQVHRRPRITTATTPRGSRARGGGKWTYILIWAHRHVYFFW